MISLHYVRKNEKISYKKFPTGEDKFSFFLFPKVFGKFKNGQKKCPIFIFIE
jgi:hypothetical protein